MENKDCFGGRIGMEYFRCLQFLQVVFIAV